MTSGASTVNEYLSELPEERQKAIDKLRKVVKKNLPKGFQETMNYGMIGYVVPHKIFPAGYHCDPKQPLPFMNIASQKNFIAIYHMGLYSIPSLLKWFTDAYAKAGVGKLDMGKSCIRFKKPENIPYELIGELASKLTVAEWIEFYQSNLSSRKK
jgi:uncharacterized protein YdhG (YjbR/CyaY superfamily)